MSPLRYPGSKRKMLPALQQLIEANIPQPELFIEPFCGGASVSLGLLETGAVQRAVLADKNPLLASFWVEATTNPERLIADMNREPVTVERWEYWRKAKPRSPRNQALKCLFLNRTTFSGIIGGSAGPIGGRAQTSEYKIDCRFDKTTLARRIRTVGELAKAGKIVGVFEASWQETVRRAEYLAADYSKDATVFYLDPPYIQKADKLYDLSFSEFDHRLLARFLTEETSHRWILSYDKAALVRELYVGRPGVHRFGSRHTYTMKGSKRSTPVPGREVIFTNLPNDPTQLERTTAQ